MKIRHEAKITVGKEDRIYVWYEEEHKIYTLAELEKKITDLRKEYTVERNAEKKNLLEIRGKLLKTQIEVYKNKQGLV